jgi:hypothetical protein
MVHKMKLMLPLIFLFFHFAIPVYAIDITLRWAPNNEPNVAGYRAFYREESQPYDYENPYWESTEPACTIYDLEPHVKILRDFRDRFLFGNTIGNRLVSLYYTYSPPIADFIKKHNNLRVMVRISLLPLVGFSWVALKTGIVSAVALLLIFISLFAGRVRFKRSKG